MDWYVFRTLSGKEELVLSMIQKTEVFSEFEVFYPKRKIGWRKSGNIISIIRPLFEGYLFVTVGKEKIEKFEYLLRKCKMNLGYLVRSAGCLVPIAMEEKQLLQKLMTIDKVVDASKVDMSADEVKVVEGPLLGMEDRIKKICKKNRRITVEIPILHEKKKIELEGILVNTTQPLHQ